MICCQFFLFCFVFLNLQSKIIFPMFQFSGPVGNIIILGRQNFTMVIVGLSLICLFYIVHSAHAFSFLLVHATLIAIRVVW